MSLRKANFVSDFARATHHYLDEVQEIRNSYRDLFTPILSDEFDDFRDQLSRFVEILEVECRDHD